MYCYQEITIGYHKEDMEKFLLNKGYEIGLEIDEGGWDRWNDWSPNMQPAVKKSEKLISLKNAFREEFRKEFDKKILGI